MLVTERKQKKKVIAQRSAYSLPFIEVFVHGQAELLALGAKRHIGLLLNSSIRNHSNEASLSLPSDPPVEIEDEDKMFHVLMEFAKADVNSPRSVRALSKVRLSQHVIQDTN